MDSGLVMKRTLIILAILVTLGTSGLLAQTRYQQNIAVEQSSALVMAVTTDVLVNWAPQTIRDNASRELLARESAEQIQQRFIPMSRRLGALQEIYDIEYDVDIPGWWQPDATARAQYTMSARFQSEVATVRLELIRENGRWLISEYDIQPPRIAA